MIFKVDDDRRFFLSRFRKSLDKYQVTCYAWCLMGNHVHMLLSPSRVPLSKMMISLLTSYAQYFNRKYRRVGYLFQNRYKSILCEKEEYFLQLVRYIHLNPLRAGLVKTLNELKKYKWCSHNMVLKNVDDDAFFEVRSYFSSKQGYLDFLNDDVHFGQQVLLENGGVRRNQKGWEVISMSSDDKKTVKSDERILGSSEFIESIIENHQFNKKAITLEAIKHEICKKNEIEVYQVNTPRRANKYSRIRKIIAKVASALGFNSKDIGETLGVSGQAVSKMLNDESERTGEVDALICLIHGRP